MNAVLSREPVKALCVEWNQTAAMAEARMRAGGCDMLQVVDGRRLLGHITRADIDRCRRHGNWLDAVLVVDLVGEGARSGS
ncbi:MAG: hypothetical protein H6852_12340 [Geminicoccaceae bacterium]|jgi:hypothetical protein|nr:hypothetical protein [Geminicoccaceae bacterium]MCB9968408.1 hypothetical protein [Geminicoccaceae bacterium]HRY25958.1 hypothetical protein [Geminicoccaceae bacterium]